MKISAVTESIDRRADWLFSLSDAIFDRPETAFREYFAAGLLCDALRREGFRVTEAIGGLPTAFCGRFGEGKPVIGILGEYDALPGMSQRAGIAHPEPVEAGAAGHGCGHNLLGVGSLAAVIAVKDYLEANRLPGTVIYFGCPGEEGGAGKGFLARAGVFDGVDCVLAWHPASLNTAPPRTSLANQQMLYQFRGISAHAAAHPERGRSALDALTLMNTGIQFLREHIPATAKIHYAVLDAGGTSPNVVQSSASAMYLIRETSQDTLEPLVQRVNQVARGGSYDDGNPGEHHLHQKLCQPDPQPGSFRRSFPEPGTNAAAGIHRRGTGPCPDHEGNHPHREPPLLHGETIGRGIRPLCR